MKAVVYHGTGDIRLDKVADPKLKAPTDAIVRVTTAAICGTDLHFIRGTVPGMVPGTIIGHEGVGVVEEVGKEVSNFKRGERVLLSAVLGCGSCPYCQSGTFSQCDDVNPNGPRAGGSYFGAPAATGPIDGLQAEYARVPFAHINLFRLPDSISDAQAIPISDIYPTAYFGAVLAGVSEGDTVAVWGCGPVGQFAVVSAFQRGAARVIAVDHHPDRLERARQLGAEIINFDEVDPVAAMVELTRGRGPHRAIDAVGVDSESARKGPAVPSEKDREEDRREVSSIVEKTNVQNGNWQPGNAPSQAVRWAVESLAKAGTLASIGVYPPEDRFFPLGMAMGKNLTLRTGVGDHPKYIRQLLRLVEGGLVDPSRVLTQHEPLTDVLDAYRQFDLRSPGWLKVALNPAA
jgi:threonine dehydrogenase-like Zn-dependent dehydrogenase